MGDTKPAKWMTVFASGRRLGEETMAETEANFLVGKGLSSAEAPSVGHAPTDMRSLQTSIVRHPSEKVRFGTGVPAPNLEKNARRCRFCLRGFCYRNADARHPLVEWAARAHAGSRNALGRKDVAKRIRGAESVPSCSQRSRKTS
jgi:hypothetical protein